jgi:hypothetical protein
MNIFTVGKPRVSRYFKGKNPDGTRYDGWFDGTVDCFRYGLYYHVKYDDGDAEDLDLAEVLEAVSCFYNPKIRSEKLANMKRRRRRQEVEEPPRAKRVRKVSEDISGGLDRGAGKKSAK